jgi:hypothetical protein
MKSVRLAIIFLGLLVAITLHSGPIQAQGDLEARVQKLWSAKVGQDWGQAYHYYCASYKQKVTKKEFTARANLNILGYEVGEIQNQANGTLARVPVSFRIKKQGFEFPATTLKEPWVYEQGQWYCCPKSKGARALFE